MLKKMNLLYISLILLSITLASCSQPKVNPEPVRPFIESYLEILKRGDLKEAQKTFFMPLHWRRQQKMYKYFTSQHQQLTEEKLSLKIISQKQKGRWAVAALEHTNAEGKMIKPLWFFYYDKHWQVVSPVIFKTAPVRSMIDLHREQKNLRLWFYQQYPTNKKA